MKTAESKFCSSPFSNWSDRREGQGKGGLAVDKVAEEAQKRSLLRVQKSEQVIQGQTLALSIFWTQRTWFANKDEGCRVNFFAVTWRDFWNPLLLLDAF